jgi:hypothetical protein
MATGECQNAVIQSNYCRSAKQTHAEKRLPLSHSVCLMHINNKYIQRRLRHIANGRHRIEGEESFPSCNNKGGMFLSWKVFDAVTNSEIGVIVMIF